MTKTVFTVRAYEVHYIAYTVLAADEAEALVKAKQLKDNGVSADYLEYSHTLREGAWDVRPFDAETPDQQDIATSDALYNDVLLSSFE